MALTTALSVGCAKTEAEHAEHGDHEGHAVEATAASVTAGGHEHGAWWCDAHGVPEEVCALCDTKLAADFQKKGDWCAEHDRPDSQCFKCHPELEAKFAAQYEAMYGKQPPKPSG
jgi:cobalt-zinc-cadmium efflux system membrane fusion protein